MPILSSSTMMKTCLFLLALAGLVTVLQVVYSVIDFLLFHFSTPSEPLRAYKRKGSGPSYALITGASAGIGLGIARELVQQGFSVILLGHQSSELAEAKASLEAIAGDSLTVRTLVVDARTATPAQLAAAIDSIQELPITILVNNVGGCPVQLPPLRALATYSCADVDAVLDMNARFMARLTALLLPVLSRPPARDGERSLILNMSSSGICGIPWLVMYGATKAFNLTLARGLARELEASPATRHVDSLAILPGEVLTQGNCKGVPSRAIDGEAFGRCVVRRVDGAVRRRMRDVMPYWQHHLESIILSYLNEDRRTAEILKVLSWKKREWDAFYAKVR